MADKTKIEWTDATWNPVTGCTKVSPGCDHCYAERVTERFSGKGSFANVTLHPDRLDQPLRWRKPRKVFVNSMSDLFHDDVPDEFIAQVFAVMALAPQHTFQILTKRHGRMRSLLTRPEWREMCEEAQAAVVNDPATALPTYRREQLNCRWWSDFAKPLPNVWLGVSVEDQKWADIRIPALLDTPAAVRFLSCEPLLGPIDLPSLRCPCGDCSDPNYAPGIGWVIVGGESGPGARPMHPEWARSLRDQCVAAGVPFLFKQWGEWVPGSPNIYEALRGTHVVEVGGGAHARLGEQIHTITARGGVVMDRVGKKTAGRELDGRTWDEYPEAS